MLDARTGIRIWETAMGLVAQEVQGAALAPVEMECEICSDPATEGNYCGGCHDQVRNEEIQEETEERKTRWQKVWKKSVKAFGTEQGF